MKPVIFGEVESHKHNFQNRGASDDLQSDKLTTAGSVKSLS